MRFEQQNLESVESERNPEVYFSVSNLIRGCVVKKEDGSTERFDLAIKGKDLNGKTKYQAIGGGAKMPLKIIEQMKKEFGDKIRFRGGEEADDARFYVSIPDNSKIADGDSEEQQRIARKNLNEFVHSIFDRFSEYVIEEKNVDVDDEDNFSYEVDADREMREELVKAGIFDPNEVANIETSFVGTVSPIQWGKTTSGRSDGAVAYHRIFNLFDMYITEKEFKKIKESDKIRVFSEEDISNIKEATQKGLVTAELADGSVVVENIFPEFCKKDKMA